MNLSDEDLAKRLHIEASLSMEGADDMPAGNVLRRRKEVYGQLFQRAADEIDRLRASQAKVVEALRSLVAKLDECEEPITAVCAMAAVRGFPYRGPNYKAEIAAACTALAEHGGQT